MTSRNLLRYLDREQAFLGTMLTKLWSDSSLSQETKQRIYLLITAQSSALYGVELEIKRG